MAVERLHHGLDHERQEAQPDALASLVRIRLGGAQVHHGRHVGFERAVGGRYGRGASHLGGDSAAHLGVRNQNFVLARLPDDGRRR